MISIRALRSLPAAVMMWTIHDPVIEKAREREKQFHDIRRKGFGGIAAFVRCSSYSWADAAAADALGHIGRLCAKHGMLLWAGLDPRFVSHEILKQAPGLSVLMSCRTPRDGRLNAVRIEDGRFRLSYDLSPRPVHTMREGAVRYVPLGLYKVYALRADAIRAGKGALRALGDEDIRDVTSAARWSFEHSLNRVEVWGDLSLPGRGKWCAVAFLRLDTNHFDFSEPLHRRHYHAMLRNILAGNRNISGILWDEPGYTCSFGIYPAGARIERQVRQRTGTALGDAAWKLILPAADGSHACLRAEYFRLLQESVNRAQADAGRIARAGLGGKCLIGMHDTWHWESADMCDMNHGSLDLWKGLRVKSGGFVDLGSAHLLREPDSPFYRNLAAACILGASLGRHSPGKFAFNNCWTAGRDSAWQMRVMEHCARAMALYGTRWFAHIYGPAGIPGQEHSFLGLPFTPGYPDHCTWEGMREWTRLIGDHLDIAQHRFPRVNVLMVFPVDTLYRMGDPGANVLAERIFDLLLLLTDRHYQVDLVSASLADRFDSLGGYDAAIFPSIVSGTPEHAWARALRKRLPLFVSHAAIDSSATRRRRSAVHTAGEERRAILAFLRKHPRAKFLDAPRNSWATVTPLRDGMLVTIIPSRRSFSYEGTLAIDGARIPIPRSSGMTRVLLPASGEPRFIA